MTAIKNGTLLVKDSNGNTARVATLSQTDITTLNTALTDIDTNSVRIQAIEDKNAEQDGRLDAIEAKNPVQATKKKKKKNPAP